jgi:hypothetical protein
VKEKLKDIEMVDEQDLFHRLQELLNGIPIGELRKAFTVWIKRLLDLSKGDGSYISELLNFTFVNCRSMHQVWPRQRQPLQLLRREVRDARERFAGLGAFRALRALRNILGHELVPGSADGSHSVASRVVWVFAPESGSVVAHRKADHNRRLHQSCRWQIRLLNVPMAWTLLHVQKQHQTII